MAESLAHVMMPKPWLTPHSMTEPFTSITRRKISYSARKRVRFWRRTYFGKFSSLVSQGEGLRSKQARLPGASSFSASVRSPPETAIFPSSDIDTSAVERRDCVADVVDVVFRERRVHRQQHEPAGHLLGVWTISTQAERRELVDGF